ARVLRQISPGRLRLPAQTRRPPWCVFPCIAKSERRAGPELLRARALHLPRGRQAGRHEAGQSPGGVMNRKTTALSILNAAMLVAAPAASAQAGAPVKMPTAVGFGGAVATVDA